MNKGRPFCKSGSAMYHMSIGTEGHSSTCVYISTFSLQRAKCSVAQPIFDVLQNYEILALAECPQNKQLYKLDCWLSFVTLQPPFVPKWCAIISIELVFSTTYLFSY